MQHFLQMLHRVGAWRVVFFKGKFDPHLIVFRLTDLLERQQLDPVNNGILLRERIEKSHTLGGVVERRDNDLPQRGGDLFLVQ